MTRSNGPVSLANLADNLPQIVWTARADGAWDYVNARWTEHTGLSAEQGLGLGWQQGLHPDDAHRCAEAWADATRTGRPFEAEARLVTAGGQYRWHLARARPVADSGDGALRWLGSWTDIEDLKRAQGLDAQARRRGESARDEAEAANRAKDEFLAMISHELRTPLGAILIWSQLLRDEKMDEAGMARALGMIERSTKTLAKLIDDLLDVSRIIAGKLTLESRAVQLGPVVEAALGAAQPDVEAKGLRLELVTPAGAVNVCGDAVRLQQVLGNLLSNAVKFTPDGGRLRVALETTPTHARITIADTGMGINPEFLPFIFERFRQADTTSTRRNKGLGLGLAISRHLVELHGGTIEASSPGEGQGSAFAVTVPLARSAAGDVPAAAAVRSDGWPAQGRSLEGVRVLVVDDESDARDALALVLERCGARVTAVASAAEALGAWRREPYDVLLSDIAMPGEDGYSLIRKIATAGSDARPLPAVAVTAYATSEDRQRALEAGYRDHLTKPVDPGALVATVARLAGRPLPSRAPLYPSLGV
ncbi:MAG TPA: ATP-binding protein [Vicinamibacteria bacterium]|nr:ATP-binding protein [Vicinamibacteria bacterium]